MCALPLNGTGRRKQGAVQRNRLSGDLGFPGFRKPYKTLSRARHTPPAPGASHTSPFPFPPHLNMAALAANTLVGVERLAPRLQKTRGAKRASFVTRAGKYDAELLETATNMTKAGKGILAMDESNATCGSRLEAGAYTRPLFSST